MKRNLIALVALTAALTANAGPEASYEPKSYALKKAEPTAMAEPPVWFIQPPDDTPDMVFSSGYGESSNLRLVVDKCMTDAKNRLSHLLGSQVKSSTKSYVAESNGSTTETHETTIHKFTDSTIVGAQRVDTQLVRAGTTYQMFCLIRYPLAENNVLRKEMEARRAKREGELRSARAHQDLERKVQTQRAEQKQADRELKEEIGPQPGVVVTPVTNSVATPVSSSDSKVNYTEFKTADEAKLRAINKASADALKNGSELVVGKAVIQTD